MFFQIARKKEKNSFKYIVGQGKNIESFPGSLPKKF